MLASKKDTVEYIKLFQRLDYSYNGCDTGLSFFLFLSVLDVILVKVWHFLVNDKSQGFYLEQQMNLFDNFNFLLIVLMTFKKLISKKNNFCFFVFCSFFLNFFHQISLITGHISGWWHKKMKLSGLNVLSACNMALTAPKLFFPKKNYFDFFVQIWRYFCKRRTHSDKKVSMASSGGIKNIILDFNS